MVQWKTDIQVNDLSNSNPSITEVRTIEEIVRMSQKRRTRRRFSPEQKVAILKRYEITGSVEPSPHGGGKPPKLTSEQREIVQVSKIAWSCGYDDAQSSVTRPLGILNGSVTCRDEVGKVREVKLANQ